MSLQLSTDSSARSLPEVLRQGARTPLRKAFVCIPGVVRSFDAAKARASVQPAIDYLIDDDTSQVSHAEILDVPVVYPSGGGYATVFPLTAGDDVLLHFSQRGLTDWKDRMERGVDASASAPDAGVMFRFQDAFATPGFLAGDVNVPADAIETRVPPNGNVRINGIDAFTTEGPLLASVSIPAGTLTADPVLAAATGLPRGFSVASGSLMVAPNAYWHERVTGLQVLARLADGSVASRVSFGYRPSGGESKALHLNGTEASAVHVSYGSAAAGGGGGRGSAVYSLRNQSIRHTVFTLPTSTWRIPASGVFELRFSTVKDSDNWVNIYHITAESLRDLTALSTPASTENDNGSYVLAFPVSNSRASDVDRLFVARTADNQLLWGVASITRNFDIDIFQLSTGGGGGVSDSASPLTIAHNGAVTTQACVVEVRLMLNGGPHTL